MAPTPCRVRTCFAGETSGTIGIVPSGAESFAVTLGRADFEAVATLTREQAFSFLLAAANALGLVLLDPREAARRHAAARNRGR